MDKPPYTIGNEGDGSIYVWGGAFSGFTIEPYDYDGYNELKHRCGWRYVFLDEYVGNIVFDQLLKHLSEGCYHGPTLVSTITLSDRHAEYYEIMNRVTEE